MLDTQAAEPEPLRRASTKEDNVIWMWLVGTTFFLGLLLIVVVSICLSQRSNYRRQLRAATISAFGVCDDVGVLPTKSYCRRRLWIFFLRAAVEPRQPDHVGPAAAGGRVPNTNMHSVAGSNPMWLQSYENEWYKDRETLRYDRVTCRKQRVRSVQTARGVKSFC